METEPKPQKSNRIYGVISTLLWMLVAFIAGIFVGVHPEWVPNMSWAYHPALDQNPGMMHIPTSQPTTDSSTGDSQMTLPATRP